jgi:hypothetical protein
VSTVASQSEIERLTERLTAPVLAPAVVKPAAASSNAEELVKDVGAALAKAWPAQPVLTGFDVTSNAAGLLVNARYIAARAMDATAVGLIERDLAADLKVPAVTLNAVRISAAEAAKQAAANAERTKPKAPRISMLPGASKGS